ncbi:hypothetical protein ACHAXS_009041 [Conticribra weissflogii]
MPLRCRNHPCLEPIISNVIPMHIGSGTSSNLHHLRSPRMDFHIGLLTLGVLNGDFCFDTPDAQMNKILAQTLYHQSRVAYNVAYYYVNGCPSEYQSNLAQFAYARILEARAAMLDFNTLLQNFFDGFLSEACGAILVSDGGESPMNALGVLSFILLEHLQGTSKVVVAFAEVLMCRSFHPLYAVLMYDMVWGVL